MIYPEYDLTPEEADAYCAGSENQRVRQVIADIVGDNYVLDVGCGNGIDAHRYDPRLYLGIDGSLALITAAIRKNPRYSFLRCDATDLPYSSWMHWTARSRKTVVVLKAILEHAHSQEDALTIYREALRVGQHVLVAWHTPPSWKLDAPIIQPMTGHFGRAIYQNTYQAESFFLNEEAVGSRSISVAQVDNYQLWSIA